MRLTALARLAGCLGLGLLLVSCSSQAPKPTSKGVAGPGGYLRPHRDGAPAELWRVHSREGGAGTAMLGRVGVIASVTEPFCADCALTGD